MSLLDEGNVPAENIENNQSEVLPPDTSPSWHWDENTPGQGERPSWLQPKFKSVAEAAKSFNELEKLKGAAPSEYDFSKGEGWIEPDYEPFQQMAEFAKSKHVPQDVMDNFLDTVGLYLDEFKVDISEEKTKLGEKATERLQVLNNWARSNLSEKSFNALTTGMRTAEQIEALEELRSKMLNSNTMVPSNNSGMAHSGITIEEYRAELQSNYNKYKTEPHYREEMKRKLESIVARGK